MIRLCAGQGRDVVGALVDHPRRVDVVARLVELDPRNVAHAQRRNPRLTSGRLASETIPALPAL
jgi:hypothetical protein